MDLVECASVRHNQLPDLESYLPHTPNSTKLEAQHIPESRHNLQIKKAGGRPKSFVWQYYSQHSDANVKSKRCEVSCNFCQSRMLSRVEQMESHLAHHCTKCTADIKELMKERIIAAKELSKAKKAAQEKEDQLSKANSSSLLQAILSPNPQPPVKRQRVDHSREDPAYMQLQLQFSQVSQLQP